MTPTETIINSQALLDHWQGHRRLTRHVIEAFPDDKLFSFSIGSMRPFSEMIKEFLKMTEPIAHGVATGQPLSFSLVFKTSGMNVIVDRLRKIINLHSGFLESITELEIFESITLK